MKDRKDWGPADEYANIKMNISCAISVLTILISLATIVYWVLK